jgi:UDP-glucuronate 4-epimerase
VPDTYADVEALVKDVGYKPNTPISEGIDKFVKWYVDYFAV